MKFDKDWFVDRLYATKRTQVELSRFLGMDKATIHNLLNGKRRLQLAEVQPIAQFLDATPFEVLQHAGIEFNQAPPNQSAPVAADGDSVAIAEVDVKKLVDMGTKRLQENDCKGRWEIPKAYIESELKVTNETAVILEVLGDSMEPTLCSGDRVMVDTTDQQPSPAGLFAVWDSISVIIKRVEHIPGSSPAMLKIKSDNPLHESATIPAADVTIIGRVIWSARKL